MRLSSVSRAFHSGSSLSDLYSMALFNTSKKALETSFSSAYITISSLILSLASAFADSNTLLASERRGHQNQDDHINKSLGNKSTQSFAERHLIISVNNSTSG